MIALAIRQSAAAGPTSNEGRAIVATALCLHEHCLGSTRAVAEQHTLESYFDIVIVAIVGGADRTNSSHCDRFNIWVVLDSLRGARSAPFSWRRVCHVPFWHLGGRSTDRLTRSASGRKRTCLISVWDVRL